MAGLNGLSLKVAYKKIGVRWEDVDLEGLEMDNATLSKKLLIRCVRVVAQLVVKSR